VCMGCLDKETAHIEIRGKKIVDVCQGFSPAGARRAARDILNSTLVLPVDLSELIEGPLSQPPNEFGEAPQPQPQPQPPEPSPPQQAGARPGNRSRKPVKGSEGQDGTGAGQGPGKKESELEKRRKRRKKRRRRKKRKAAGDGGTGGSEPGPNVF
jgi:hypothetical protein